MHYPLQKLSFRNRVTPVSIQDGVSHGITLAALLPIPTELSHIPALSSLIPAASEGHAVADAVIEDTAGHCGRNTHFRQIYFGVPDFNFKYIIYIKFKELRDIRIFFEEITQKLASRENYASVEIKCTTFLLFFK